MNENECIRLDKLLTNIGVGSRSEVKAIIKSGRVSVNDTHVKKPDTKVNTHSDIITLDKKQLIYNQFEYYMLNKPQGVVSAVKDNLYKTVVDIIVENIDYKRDDLFPVGRLDKDTEGLLLITNDGELAHSLLSPKKHVEKVYYAKISDIVTKEDCIMFEKGIHIDEQFHAMPAKLNIIKNFADKQTDESVQYKSEVEITIYEGKFHQVKRMFQAIGKEVVFLKRLCIGKLKLDENLKCGEFRKLTEDELQRLKGE